MALADLPDHIERSPIPRQGIFSGHPGAARNGVILLIVVTAVLRLIEGGVIDLGLGEAYYLSSARQLHLGYFDQPPLSLWLIWATKTIFGSEDPLLLRLPFILLFSGSTWLLYRIGARYRSEWAGFLAALVMNISILFTISIGSWLQPDSPLMLFWLMTCWVLLDIFFDPDPHKENSRWLWAGFWLGLTFLTKYHAVFIVAGTGLFILTNARARHWLWHPGPYLAVLLAAVISLPVFGWNAGNEWASFAFQGGRATGTGFHPEWLIRMIIGQIAFITPWISLPALWAAGLAASRGPSGIFPSLTRSGFAWFLFLMGIIPIAFFTIIAAFNDTQFHFHWQAPGYMMLFVLLGGWADAAWTRHKRLIVTWLTAAAVVNFLIWGVLISHTATGWLRYVLPNGETMADPTGGVVEWRELGQFFDQANLSPETDFVVGTDWTWCGQMDTPLAGRVPLACFARDPRNIAFNIDIGEMVGRTAYFVAPDFPADAVKAQFGSFFDSIEPVTRLDITRNGFVELHNLDIVKATNFHLDRSIATNGGATADITRLPRTKITGLSGTIGNQGNARTVSLMLGGREVGTVSVLAGRPTDFLVPVKKPRWSVGLEDVPLELVDEAGSSDGLSLTTLSVTER